MTLHVTFCTYDKPHIVGGVSSWIQHLLPSLVSRGIAVRCFVFLHTGEKGPVSRALEEGGVQCVYTRAHEYAEDRVRWTLEQLFGGECDVFVPNEVVAAYHAAGWARQSGIPTVGVLHSAGRAGDASQSLFVFGKDSRALSAIVCVSKEIEARVIAKRPTRTLVRRIPCGVEVPATTASYSSETFRILFAGRLANEAKRATDIARAFCRAATEIPGVTAAIFGDGPQREDVLRIVKENGAGRVIWGGLIDPPEMQDEFLHSQAVGLLSDYEGLPVSIMEGMACGAVPVCFRIPSGVPELVTDHVTGLLIDDRGDAFVRAIRELRESQSLWESLSANARILIEREYSSSVCADAWKTLLEEIAAQRTRRTPIRIPRKLRLPTPIPPLEFPAERKPVISAARRIYQSSRMYLGRVRQNVVGRRS